MKTLLLNDVQLVQYLKTGLITVFAGWDTAMFTWTDLTIPCNACANSYHKGTKLAITPKKGSHGSKLERIPCPGGCVGGRRLVNLVGFQGWDKISLGIFSATLMLIEVIVDEDAFEAWPKYRHLRVYQLSGGIVAYAVGAPGDIFIQDKFVLDKIPEDCEWAVLLRKERDAE